MSTGRRQNAGRWAQYPIHLPRLPWLGIVFIKGFGFILIKQANENDIPTIEAILSDAVIWMQSNGFENRWNKSNIRWAFLSRTFTISDFYIAYSNEIPTACMALTDYDPTYWPDIPKGESLYLHKLAVKRLFAGKGFSEELINFAKNIALKSNINAIRLNCNQHKPKLRAVYEKSGFVCVEEKSLSVKYDIALYLFKVKQ